MSGIDNLNKWKAENVGAFNADVIVAVNEIRLRLEELEDNILWLNRATNYCGCTDQLCKAEVAAANKRRKRADR